jgi:hypothetical protein
MRSFSCLFTILLLAIPVVSSGQSTDSILVGSWHFDEASPYSVIDSSGYHNNGSSNGTSVVAGSKGNGRSFNGTSDYISIYDYTEILSFVNTLSFRIDFSFKTDALNGTILRKGVAPLPGYLVEIAEGHLQGSIGNRNDLPAPNKILTITSAERVDDNLWHRASFIRDQEAHKLILVIDGAQAATPVADDIAFDLSNTDQLSIGRGNDSQNPTFFRGQLDEIRMIRFFTVLSDTQALWHFDESSPSTAVDASPYGNVVTVYGTTVVPGMYGNARHFSGSGEHMWENQLPVGCFNFGVSTSFTAEAWFKTASANDQPIVMQGNYSAHAQPTWQIKTYGGYAAAFMGNSNSSASGDPYLLLYSKNRVDDNKWHLLTFVRDRDQRKLFLYVDGILSNDPLEDTYPYAIASTRPLTIGRWEDTGNPYYFNGSLDEIAVYRGARHPSWSLTPKLTLSTESVDFGKVLVGDSATAVVQMSNAGLQDTLRISEIDIHAPFSCNLISPLLIAPRASVKITFTYRPASGGLDTVSFLMATNDPDHPSVTIHLQGRAVGVTSDPTILSVADIPGDQGHKLRIVWLRSLYDGLDSSKSLVGYDVWRRVDNGPLGAPSGGTGSFSLQGYLWDFVETIPPVGFNEYSAVAPTLYDSTVLYGMYRSVFMVSARTSSGTVYFSDADSGYSVDNLAPQAPGNLMGSGAGTVHLQWDPPADSDILLYEVYRGTTLNFVPTFDKIIGSTHTNSYTDATAPQGVAYYCISAIDSAGNRGAYSQKVGLIVTEVNTNGDQLPHQFSLSQSYPNPFNPSTRIQYDVPSQSHVSIRIYDVLGREVETLVNEEKPAGRYTVMWKAGNRSSGVYWYVMSAGSFHKTERMLLLK